MANNSDDLLDDTIDETMLDEFGEEIGDGFDSRELQPSFIGSAPEALNRYTHCAICGSNLHFTYYTDFTVSLTEETAKCPECGVKAHRVSHKLQ